MSHHLAVRPHETHEEGLAEPYRLALLMQLADQLVLGHLLEALLARDGAGEAAAQVLAECRRMIHVSAFIRA